MPSSNYVDDTLTQIIARLQPEIAHRRRELRTQRKGEDAQSAARLDADTRRRIEEIVNAKAEAAGKRANMYTAGVVASSVIPPLVGGAADIALVIAMQRDIASKFAIDVDDDADFMTKGLRALLASVRHLVTEAGVSALIRMTARRGIFRQVTKFIPGVGFVVSAAIGVGLVRRIAKETIKRYSEAATQVLTRALIDAP